MDKKCFRMPGVLKSNLTSRSYGTTGETVAWTKSLTLACFWAFWLKLSRPPEAARGAICEGGSRLWVWHGDCGTFARAFVEVVQDCHETLLGI